MNIQYPEWLVSLNPQTIYVLFSAVVAILIWLEGQMLKKNKGKMPESKFFKMSSILGSFWVIVSIAVIYFYEFKPIALVVPVVYQVYTFAGWVYGSRLLKRNGMPDKAENMVIPEAYIAFSQSFAIVFLGLCFSVVYYYH